MLRMIVLMMAASLMIGGCRFGDARLAKRRTDKSVAMTLRVTSPAFADGQPIPDKYATDDNISPPLAWENLPPGTKSIAVMVEDPDAPGVNPFVHWIIYNIVPTETGLAENIPHAEALEKPNYARQGRNSSKGNAASIGYYHPAPPAGEEPHHYHFQVFALGKMLEYDGNPMGRAEFLRQITGQVLASGSLVGTYQMPR